MKIAKTLHPTPYPHEKLFAANPTYEDRHSCKRHWCKRGNK